MKKSNLAPPLSPDDLVMQVEYYEDAVNRFCIEEKKPVICYCSDLSQCSSLDYCRACNNEVKEVTDIF